MTKTYLSVFVIIIFVVNRYCSLVYSQQHMVVAIGFYNLENLFDTVDNPKKFDNDFLPNGAYRYNTHVYNQKLKNLATVISDMGKTHTPDGLAILGIAEVENEDVLKDLLKDSLLHERQYQIVWFEGPDARGIDVAMLYSPKYFKLHQSKVFPVSIVSTAKAHSTTRDILLVEGQLIGEQTFILVNHWPSRAGGVTQTEALRIQTASICRQIIDSIQAMDKAAKIIVMGDLNDDPVDVSVRQVLNARGANKRNKWQMAEFFNPWYQYYTNGTGTLAYNDRWNLFDQILLSSTWVDRQAKGWRYYSSEIYSRPFMIEQFGKYKGYPKRSFVNQKWNNGYSDHFPTIVYIIKRAN